MNFHNGLVWGQEVTLHEPPFSHPHYDRTYVPHPVAVHVQHHRLAVC